MIDSKTENKIICDRCKSEILNGYIKKTPFKTGGSSVALILTGLIELGKTYECWKNENGDIIIREKAENKTN